MRAFVCGAEYPEQLPRKYFDNGKSDRSDDTLPRKQEAA
jgi:hypothetical protein